MRQYSFTFPTPFECKYSDTTGYYPTVNTCRKPELCTILFSFKSFDRLLLIVDRGADGSVGYNLSAKLPLQQIVEFIVHFELYSASQPVFLRPSIKSNLEVS